MKKIFLTLLVTISLVAVGFAGNTLKLNVKGMGGSCCENSFKAKAEKLEGVIQVSGVSASSKSAVIEYDAAKTNENEIISKLTKQTGYTIVATTSDAGSNVAPKSCCSKPGATKCATTETGKNCTKSKSSCTTK